MTNNIFNGLDKPKFNKDTLTDKKTVSSQTLGRELEQAKRRSEHQRNELFQTVVNWVKIIVYAGVVPLIIILMACWVYCCKINAYEVKAGIEKTIWALVSMIVGAIVGKHF